MHVVSVAWGAVQTCRVFERTLFEITPDQVITFSLRAENGLCLPLQYIVWLTWFVLSGAR